MGAQLNQLIVSNVRNLSAVDLSFGSQFNVFTGANGSGKTSLLEAIYLLGVGRSFRAKSMRQIISFGAQHCVVRARMDSPALEGLWLALERSNDGVSQYKIGGQVEKSAAEITKMLPVQLIDVNSHLILEGGPSYRRQFMDWGVFHVEHSFLQNWRLLQRALDHRNSMLRQKQVPPEVWNETFVKYAEAVDTARDAYIDRFRPIFLGLLTDMLSLSNVELRYNRGWNQTYSLRTVLFDAIHTDLQHGYTTKGPQRAEIEILIGGRPVKEVLSRGQMKIFVCIMLLARAQLLKDLRAGIFLIDDLSAELDRHSCGLFINAVKAMGCQVFITGIEAELLRDRLKGCTTHMFHVEHGTIKELSA